MDAPPVPASILTLLLLGVSGVSLVGNPPRAFSEHLVLVELDGAWALGLIYFTPVLLITAGSQHSHSDVLRDDGSQED